jgi:hypothetical protein
LFHASGNGCKIVALSKGAKKSNELPVLSPAHEFDRFAFYLRPSTAHLSKMIEE